MKKKKRTQGPIPSMFDMFTSNKGIYKALKVCLSEIDALVYFKLAYNKIHIFLHSGLTKLNPVHTPSTKDANSVLGGR